MTLTLTKELKLGSLKLPVEILASSEDRVLPSVDEGKRLARALPNGRTTVLEGSGHVPLLEARVDLASILRGTRFLERMPLGKPKDYVRADEHAGLCPLHHLPPSPAISRHLPTCMQLMSTRGYALFIISL